MGQEVLTSFSPAQQVIKIVRDELTSILGGQQAPLAIKKRPVRDPPRRPPGLRQDDHRGQARPPPQEGLRKAGPPDPGRRPAAGRDRAAAHAREGERPHGVRPERGDRCRGPGARRRQGREALRIRRGDRRHRGPPPRRRGPHGRGRAHPEGHRARRDPLRRGRDDRPGRRPLGAGVRREAPAHGRHPHEDGRRRARRRRALAREGRRKAAEVHGHGREGGRPRAVPPGPRGVPAPRPRRRPDAHREGLRRDRRGGGAARGREAAQEHVHADRPARPDVAAQEDGIARQPPRPPPEGRPDEAAREPRDSRERDEDASRR